MSLDYEKDTFIDEQSLDVEWLRQAELLRKYAKFVVQMEKEYDLTKEKLDFKKASLEKDIRDNPDSYGINKITEACIQSTILIQPEYRELSKELIEVKFELGVAKAAVRAIDQKKDALENLVRLHGASYFAGPKVPRNLTSERNKVPDVKVRITRKGMES